MIWIIISIAILINLILYPLWFLGLYKIFGRNKETTTYKDKKVYLCDNFPWFSQGIFLGFLHSCIVKRLYYTSNGKPTNVVCMTVTKEQFDKGFRGTMDIIQHELDGHEDQLERYEESAGVICGYIGWLGWCVGNYAEKPFWHKGVVSIEREPESAETSTN